MEQPQSETPNRSYICIDLKSYYASVECVARGLDPLLANLLVADESRTDKTICLAVSPSLKAKGVPSRPRLFEAKQKIREYERKTGERVQYIAASPRMAEYIRVSARIYQIYLQFVSNADVHVYSIDECFIDATDYLHLYQEEAEARGISPARCMAVRIIQEVFRQTGITATVGIGTNLYLAKVGMDIVAKKTPADPNGARIAELDETSYKLLLWTHRPLTDFWMIGPGTARRLEQYGLYTLGDVANAALSDQDFFYRIFGVDAEILLDHVWGIEPCRMQDIKNYRCESHSLSKGQVLPRPYSFKEARVVFFEMAELLASDLLKKHLTAKGLSFWISYDPKSLEFNPHYAGTVVLDFYGRPHPRHAGGAVKLPVRTDRHSEIIRALMGAFDRKADPSLLIRRLGIAATDTLPARDFMQLDLFGDWLRMEREQRLQSALIEVRDKYGPNSILSGTSYLDGATQRERNEQIGGHRKG